LVHLDVDRIRKCILPQSDQRQEHRDIAYRAMHFAAEALLRAGKDVLVTATYVRELPRRELASLVQAVRCRAFLVQFKASSQQLISRFANRTTDHAASDLTIERVVELANSFSYSKDGIIIDTSQHWSVCLNQTMEWLDKAEGSTLSNWVCMQ